MNRKIVNKLVQLSYVLISVIYTIYINHMRRIHNLFTVMSPHFQLKIMYLAKKTYLQRTMVLFLIH